MVVRLFLWLTNVHTHEKLRRIAFHCMGWSRYLFASEHTVEFKAERCLHPLVLETSTMETSVMINQPKQLSGRKAGMSLFCCKAGPDHINLQHRRSWQFARENQIGELGTLFWCSWKTPPVIHRKAYTYTWETVAGHCNVRYPKA